MNISFELLSSMSPKVNKYQNPVRKTPTVLALKKYFRKSILLQTVKSPVKDISVISIKSSSTSSTDSENILNATPIIISDSEKSFNKSKTPKSNNRSNIDSSSKGDAKLSNEKYSNICQWVNEVNSAKPNFSTFSEVSEILGDDNPCFIKPGTNVAASSTYLNLNAKRFDELLRESSADKNWNHSPTHSFTHNERRNWNNLVIDDSLENNEKDLENSFKMLNIGNSVNVFKDQDSNSSNTKEDDSMEDVSHYENLLDSLYGNSWRVNKDHILPTSEPRKKSNVVPKNVPQTERHINQKNDNNLLQILQRTRFKKTLESPWTERLKNICDSESDSESDSGGKHLLAVKLNFEDDTNNTKSKILTGTLTKNIADTKKKKTNCKMKDNVSVLQNKSSVMKTYSFLASLSGSVPIEKCDMSALIFRTKFKQHKETLAMKLFTLFNSKVFENAIPETTPIEWSDRMVRTAGTCTCKKITRSNGNVERTAKIILSNKVLDSADRLRDTLIHEMCHAATWIVNTVADGHGSFWKAWAHRAMNTFPELPPIKRCHTYVINTKYTYKCTGCGYSIGRHTKSLDIERKRCGYCLGTFEVLLNKTSKHGETKSVPATPKKPSGFALFVKENYANFKTPDLKHGDVMKILGQKFASLKVDKS